MRRLGHPSADRSDSRLGEVRGRSPGKFRSPSCLRRALSRPRQSRHKTSGRLFRAAGRRPAASASAVSRNERNFAVTVGENLTGLQPPNDQFLIDSILCKPERARQQVTESQDLGRRLVRFRHIIKQDQHLGIEFMEELATRSARHRDSGQRDTNGLNVAVPCCNSRTHRDSFRADGQSVGSVLHIAAGEDLPRCCKGRGANMIL